VYGSPSRKTPPPPSPNAPTPVPASWTGDPKAVLQELIDNIDYFDHRKTAGSLVDKDILMFGGWEDVNVTVDDFLLPFYRAVKNAGAQKVQFIVYHDDHTFRNNREALAEDIIGWINHKSSPNRRKQPSTG